MAFVKDAFAGMPTRPVLYLSLAVLALGFGYHFLTTYQECRGHAAARESLLTAIAEAADGGGPIRLSRITDFSWDRVDILINYKPKGETTDCPFEWDWSREQREKLIADDLLTVIVFLKDGKLIDYLEYPRDRADFVDVKNPYTPETAVFDVFPSPSSPPEFILAPAS